MAATLAALAAFATSAHAQTLTTAPAGPDAVPGEIVVGYRSGVDGSERAAARSAADVHAKRNLLARGVQLVRVDKGQDVHAAIASLERRRDVRYAEPNWNYHATATTPDDPLYNDLWGLNNTGQTTGAGAGTADADIDAPDAWDVSTGSLSTVVAVVDSGVAPDHPDLAPNIWTNPGEIAGNGIDDDGNGRVDDVHGWDFVDDGNNPWDYNDHGTHVAGTIAARGDNGIGITGVAWRASIMAVRALDTNGSGNNADITDAFTYAAENGAKVVNASLGGGGFSQAQSDAIANHPNTLYVVSAGNGGSDFIGDDNDAGTSPQYPCNYTPANLICVAATDNKDALGGFSNFGATSVDLAAPGVGIESARPHYVDVFTDDFESGLTKWTVQAGSWGTRNVLNSNWLTDSPGGQYANDADWPIRTASPIDVGARTDCVMKFRYGSYLGAGDVLYVESSSDRTTWKIFAALGNTAGKVSTVGYEPRVGGDRYYRFSLVSDAATNGDGVYIDNVRLACPGGTYDAGDYQYLSGTSMASPHVAGAAAVLFSSRPRAPVAKVKAALLDGGDSLSALTSKTVSGRRLNLDGALTTLLTPVGTNTALTSQSLATSVVGQRFTVRYSVASTGMENAPPTGTVTVTDGVDSCTGTVAAGGCILALTTVGSRFLIARFAGDEDHEISQSAVLAHQVNAASTATTITSDSPDPSLAGQAVTVNFAVDPVAPGAGTPTGDVTVSAGSHSCTAGVAVGSCQLKLTALGSYSLTASYAGDARFTGSASAVESHKVGIATTTAIGVGTPDASVVGQPVTVAYSVAAESGGPPGGNVTVSDGVDSCTGTVAAGRCTIALRTAGVRTLTASYAGAGLFNASRSAGQAQTVGRATTTTAILADGPDPSTRGAAVTVRYRVAVNAPGAGMPTGSVTVGDGVNRCTATAAAGRCTLRLDTAGGRTLTAAFAGDARFRPSTSGRAAHTVVQPPPPLAHVSGAKTTHRKFRVSARPRLARTSRRRVPVGTTFEYTLDRPAEVMLDFTRPGAGRLVNGSCVARRRSNRIQPKCALLRGSLTVAAHAGVNKVRFKGWLSRTKKLRRGRYALVITAITAGGATSQTVKFRVVR
jgi:subtilisin family serine protease